VLSPQADRGNGSALTTSNSKKLSSLSGLGVARARHATNSRQPLRPDGASRLRAAVEIRKLDDQSWRKQSLLLAKSTAERRVAMADRIS
jgi:hypothetical protein